MKKLLILILVIACIFICGCEADKGIAGAFDISQYTAYTVTTTISRNGGVVIREAVSVEKAQDVYIVSSETTTLAPIDGTEQYIVASDTAEYDSAEYQPTIPADPARLDITQLSQIVDVEEGRMLTLNLSAEEVSVLLDAEVDESKSDFTLTILFAPLDNVMTSMVTSYTTANGNKVEIAMEFDV